MPMKSATNEMQDALRRFKAEIFQGLGHPTCIAIVELLREGGVSARSIFERVGLEQANLSQHLGVLRSKQIVVSRKEGNQVFYSIRDPALSEVLDIMRRYFKSHIARARKRLTEIGRQEARHR